MGEAAGSADQTTSRSFPGRPGSRRPREITEKGREVRMTNQEILWEDATPECPRHRIMCAWSSPNTEADE